MYVSDFVLNCLQFALNRDLNELLHAVENFIKVILATQKCGLECCLSEPMSLDLLSLEFLQETGVFDDC